MLETLVIEWTIAENLPLRPSGVPLSCRISSKAAKMVPNGSKVPSEPSNCIRNDAKHTNMAIQILSVDEFMAKAGQKLGTSDWITLDQERINEFADCTEDHQFIHIDQENAAKTPFGGTIAHGFLTLSMLVKLCESVSVHPEGLVMGVNYVLNKVRFLAPVRAGKRVRAHIELASVERKDDNRFLTQQNITVEIEGEDTPALYAEWLGMTVVA